MTAIARERRRSPCVSLVSLAVAVLVVATGHAQPKKDDRLHTEQKRLIETQRQLKEQREKAADARKRETSVLADLENTERRLADKQKEVRQLDDRVKKTQAELVGLGADIDRLQGQRATQQAALGQRLRIMYKLHAQGAALPIILTTEDPVARAITLRQLSRLAALDARVIQEYRVVSDRLGDRRAREETRQQELASLRTEAQREQGEVDREAAKRRVLLARVRDERAYHERMVGELSEAARRLEAFVRELQSRQRRIAKVPPRGGGIEPPTAGFGTLRGRLPWPAEGRVVTTFGAQVHPRFGTRTFRNGIDIEAVEGTDVKAVYAGNVVYTGWFKGYGNLIIIDHGNDYYTLYAHVADILVHEGDDVKPGQRVGTVGDTGSLSGARLYFEVRYQGKALDPAEWLRQRG